MSDTEDGRDGICHESTLHEISAILKLWDIHTTSALQEMCREHHTGLTPVILLLARGDGENLDDATSNRLSQCEESFGRHLLSSVGSICDVVSGGFYGQAVSLERGESPAPRTLALNRTSHVVVHGNEVPVESPDVCEEGPYLAVQVGPRRRFLVVEEEVASACGGGMKVQ